MKKTIFTILLCGVMVLGITGCGEDKAKEAEKDSQETYEKYGWVEKENVGILVAKLNTEIMDGGLHTPAYDDYMVIDNDLYWFALTDRINYYLKPVSFSGNKDNDIVDMSALRFKKEGFQEETDLTYVKFLIKANNENITDSEIETLLKEAKEKAPSKKSANNGKGISVGLLETQDCYEYQVVRLFK